MNKFPFNPFPYAPLKEAIKLLEFSLMVGNQMTSSRDRVELARDKIHQVCVTMEQNGDAEEREKLYLDTFDALSYCTTALVAKPLSFTLIREALTKLRSVRDLAVQS